MRHGTSRGTDRKKASKEVTEGLKGVQRQKRPDELISLTEAAEIYGFSSGHLRHLAHRGRLKAHKVGNMWVTTPADVEGYIRNREKRGAYRNDIALDNSPDSDYNYSSPIA